MDNSRLEETLAEYSAKIEKVIDDLRAKSEERSAEMEKTIAEIRAGALKFEAEMREFRDNAELDRKEIRNMQNNIGGIGLHFGQVIEILVVPGIRPVLKKHGREYDRIESNKIIKDRDGNKIAEVDVLLDNSVEVMAVEIKTCPCTGRIEKHIRRLKTLRANEETAGVKGKTLYGAVAGAIVEPHVEKYALNNGLYFIRIIEDEDRLEIRAPETVACF